MRIFKEILKRRKGEKLLKSLNKQMNLLVYSNVSTIREWKYLLSYNHKKIWYFALKCFWISFDVWNLCLFFVVIHAPCAHVYQIDSSHWAFPWNFVFLKKNITIVCAYLSKEIQKDAQRKREYISSTSASDLNHWNR